MNIDSDEAARKLLDSYGDKIKHVSPMLRKSMLEGFKEGVAAALKWVVTEFNEEMKKEMEKDPCKGSCL